MFLHFICCIFWSLSFLRMNSTFPNAWSDIGARSLRSRPGLQMSCTKGLRLFFMTQGCPPSSNFNLDPHSLVCWHKLYPITASLDLPLLLPPQNDTSKLPAWLLFGLLPCLKSLSTSWSGTFRPVLFQALETRPCLVPQVLVVGEWSSESWCYWSLQVAGL